jgi:GNAT superfamily N-acetyltransferase
MSNIATVSPPTPATATLVSSVMRGGHPIADCPLIFGASARGRFVRHDDDEGNPLSTCAILERRAVTSAGSFGLGLIGSVVTDPNARGKGYAREVLKVAEQTLGAESCAIAMLWADDPTFYQHLGWIPAGCELDYVLYPESAFFMPDADHVRPATEADTIAIHELYLAHPERLERSLEETDALLGAPKMQIVVHEQGGEVTAYACLGRGDDLEQVVHEWGGTNEAMLACVRHFLDARGPEAAPLFLMVPPTREALVHMLDMIKTPGTVGVLGMAKIVNREAACQMLASVLPQGTSCRVVDQTTVVEGPGGHIALGDRELLLTLMPPKANAEVVEVVEASIGMCIDALPFGPFVWGLDSI